jgi:hypothetical protein
MARGADWTFEEFCRVFCAPERAVADLAAELGRSEGAVEAVRTGTSTSTFPGPKWEDFVARALAGECRCLG